MYNNEVWYRINTGTKEENETEELNETLAE